MGGGAGLGAGLPQHGTQQQNRHFLEFFIFIFKFLNKETASKDSLTIRFETFNYLGGRVLVRLYTLIVLYL